jgi:hypothetical protein
MVEGEGKNVEMGFERLDGGEEVKKLIFRRRWLKPGVLLHVFHRKL